MAIAADTKRPAGIQPGRGGFMRSIDGKPYVTDPTGTTVKSGKRKGEIKRIAYGSPSNRGMQIENSTNLVKWGERRVVLGVGLDPEIARDCAQLVDLDVDSDEYKTLADSIIVRAKEIAKANLAAQQGTHVHALTEDHDEERDWVRRAEAGEILGIDRDIQAALVDGWNRMLQRFHLEVLAVEASVVDDAWHLAGTLDRIVRLGQPLRFRKVTGEVVEIPAGLVVVGDVKTSNMRLDSNGCVQLWQAYAIQIASYAQSIPYDTAAETRGSWPYEISQQHALIFHPDLETCEWELIYVDLQAGREHGGACVVSAKEWESRNDVFSVAQLDLDEGAPASVLVEETSTRIVDHWLIRTIDSSTAAAPRPAAASTAAGDGPHPSPAAAVEGRALNWIKPTPVPTPELVVDRDEGSTVHLDEAFNEINQLYKTLDPDAKAWVLGLSEQAMHNAVSFHSHNNRTERRFWIIRGLVVLGIARLCEEEVLRALVAVAMNSDAPLFAAVKPGHALGALGAAGAQRFAELVDQVEQGRLQGRIDDSGVFVFTPAA